MQFHLGRLYADYDVQRAPGRPVQGGKGVGAAWWRGAIQEAMVATRCRDAVVVEDEGRTWCFSRLLQRDVFSTRVSTAPTLVVQYTATPLEQHAPTFPAWPFSLHLRRGWHRLNDRVAAEFPGKRCVSLRRSSRKEARAGSQCSGLLPRPLSPRGSRKSDRAAGFEQVANRFRSSGVCGGLKRAERAVCNI